MSAWKIDFSGVEESPLGLPTGKYIAVVKSVEKKNGTGEFPYIEWVFVVAKGDHKGKEAKYITSLSPKALFNLRNLLVALGISVPKSAINLDPDKLIKRPLIIEIAPKPNKDNTKMYQSVVGIEPASAGVSTPAPSVGVKATASITPDSEVVMDLGDEDDDVPFL